MSEHAQDFPSCMGVQPPSLADEDASNPKDPLKSACAFVTSGLLRCRAAAVRGPALDGARVHFADRSCSGSQVKA